MSRVDEVADELGVTSKDVLERLERLGRPGLDTFSTVDDVTVERLRTDFKSSNGGHPRGDGTTTRSDGRDASSIRDPQASKPQSGRSLLKQITELPMLVVFAFLIAVIIKTFLVQAFYIPSASMKPTLKENDRVLVEKVTGYFSSPGRGDVIVFERSGVAPLAGESLFDKGRDFVRELLGLPTGSDEDYIKRIVAQAGDTIRYEGRPRSLFVNGERVREPYLGRSRDLDSQTITAGDCRSVKLRSAQEGCRVPAGTVFVMGDNRNNSQDSRFIGPVDEDKIVGHAFVVIWPFDRVGGL